MSDRREVVRIHIAGEEFALRTETSAEQTQAAADYVDQAIRSVLEGGAIETRKAAILVALQLADELLRLRSADQAAAAQLRSLAQQLRPMLPPAHRGEQGDRRGD